MRLFMYVYSKICTLHVSNGYTVHHQQFTYQLHMQLIRKTDEECKPSVVCTSGGTTDSHVHRDQTHRLKDKIECTCYQVTQLTMDDRPRLQKLQNTFQIRLKMRAANDAVWKILCERDFDVMELNRLIYIVATVITEEINGRKI